MDTEDLRYFTIIKERPIIELMADEPNYRIELQNYNISSSYDSNRLFLKEFFEKVYSEKWHSTDLDKLKELLEPFMLSSDVKELLIANGLKARGLNGRSTEHFVNALSITNDDVVREIGVVALKNLLENEVEDVVNHAQVLAEQDGYSYAYKYINQLINNSENYISPSFKKDLLSEKSRWVDKWFKQLKTSIEYRDQDPYMAYQNLKELIIGTNNELRFNKKKEIQKLIDKTADQVVEYYHSMFGEEEIESFAKEAKSIKVDLPAKHRRKLQIAISEYSSEPLRFELEKAIMEVYSDLTLRNHAVLQYLQSEIKIEKIEKIDCTPNEMNDYLCEVMIYSTLVVPNWVPKLIKDLEHNNLLDKNRDIVSKEIWFTKGSNSWRVVN